MKHISCLLLALFAFSMSAMAQGIMTTLPDEVDTEARYVFYIPDDGVTPNEPEPQHPQYGRYHYMQITNQLLAAGFAVVSRPRETTEHAYMVAEEIADQVQRLIDAGVPASNIGIMGAAKGGAITVLVTSRLANPDLQVVVLSLCTETFIEYWITRQELLSGNVLSIIAGDAGKQKSCLSYLEHCAKLNVKKFRELTLPGMADEGFYYRPSGHWMIPAIEWLRGRHDAVGERGLARPPDIRKP
jgi:hypothetical protein